MDFDLYPKSRRPFDAGLFRNPTSEYRGTPFWAWNGKLDRAELLRQLDIFREMGMGGAHIHVRTGLATPYLGEAYMSLVKACVDHARDHAMLIWLYDEDRWPSGAAGGIVTKDESLRRKHLLFTQKPYGQAGEVQRVVDNRLVRSENGRLLARFAVTLRGGQLYDYRPLQGGEKPAPDEAEWFAYLEHDRGRPWFNGQAYLDLLNPAAVRRFIYSTHDAYRAAVGSAFGKTIPAIFTDEPQFARQSALARPDDTADQFLPWTDDIDPFFLTHLPELLWDDQAQECAAVRWKWLDYLTEKFATSFMDQLGDWCGRHGIALTGHMMSEESLGSQTGTIGEAMRSYRKMQLPGIDLLCDHPEYTTAKQCQSAVRQFGRCGMLSELYGVTHWDFPFAGHKAQGDWQAVFGVTVRVHHLAWMQMGGESKRDYPASIFFQSPWWKQYAKLEDHFSRLNVAMTRGRPVVRVAMVHPIESFWISGGPRSQNADTHREQEQAFREGVEWLMTGLVDFDYLCESMLPDQSDIRCDSGTLNVGAMKYNVVIVPPMRTIRSSTLERLMGLEAEGGEVIFAGEVPSMVDGIPSEAAIELARRCRRVSWSRTAVLAALEEFGEVRAEHADGSPTRSLIYQLREEGDTRWLLIANTERRWGNTGVRLTLRGEWQPVIMDTLSGDEQPLAATYRDGDTHLVHDFEACGHLLLRLAAGRSTVAPPPAARWTTICELPSPSRVTLDEPNVLLLDQAEFRINDGPWQSREETLRIQNFARQTFGLLATDGYIVQPWADREPLTTLGEVSLRFAIETEIDIAAPVLALEDVDVTTMKLDGRPVEVKGDGWWVDPCLAKVALPALSKGRHELVLRRPFHRKSTIEWCYLLGDFGVRVAGRFATITPPVRNLHWGDITTQGLPFYTGNVAYHVSLPTTPERFAVRVPHHAAATLQLTHGRQVVDAMVPPYRAVFTRKGDDLAITAFGNRFNAFGTLHHANPHDKWYGPRAWRTSGDAWTYEYQLKRSGILAAPVIEERV